MYTINIIKNILYFNKKTNFYLLVFIFSFACNDLKDEEVHLSNHFINEEINLAKADRLINNTHLIKGFSGPDELTKNALSKRFSRGDNFIEELVRTRGCNSNEYKYEVRDISTGKLLSLEDLEADKEYSVKLECDGYSQAYKFFFLPEENHDASLETEKRSLKTWIGAGGLILAGILVYMIPGIQFFSPALEIDAINMALGESATQLESAAVASEATQAAGTLGGSSAQLEAISASEAILSDNLAESGLEAGVEVGAEAEASNYALIRKQEEQVIDEIKLQLNRATELRREEQATQKAMTPLVEVRRIDNSVTRGMIEKKISVVIPPTKTLASLGEELLGGASLELGQVVVPAEQPLTTDLSASAITTASATAANLLDAATMVEALAAPALGDVGLSVESIGAVVGASAVGAAATSSSAYTSPGQADSGFISKESMPSKRPKRGKPCYVTSLDIPLKRF